MANVRKTSPIPAQSETTLTLEMTPQESHAAPMVQQVDTTPAGLLAMAYQRGAIIAELQSIMQMKMDYEKDEARKAYALDFAEFKRRPITIIKDKLVSFKTEKGTTSYTHATIGNVVEKITAQLAEFGFSHSWKPERLEGGLIQVTCTITHRLGHSDSVALSAGLDSSGGKNNIQAMSSTVTYLERYTLLAITGCATHDQQDDDGQGEEESGVASLYSSLVEELQKLTKFEACETFFKTHRAKFQDDKKQYQAFKAACENHAAFIQTA